MDNLRLLRHEQAINSSFACYVQVMNKAQVMQVMNNLHTSPEQAMCKSPTSHVQCTSNEQVAML